MKKLWRRRFIVALTLGALAGTATVASAYRSSLPQGIGDPDEPVPGKTIKADLAEILNLMGTQFRIMNLR